MATLISLIKDNKVGKNVQANMAGANQHMTYTDKELDNVIDISHLRIKVGHPNGTEAYISKIRNLRLSNGLTLYDVMVIPQYCVTLISVHKLAKENKVIVAFDENRCYFLNQDLSLKNILGIGDQCEVLLGHPAEPVLNVLKDSLQIDKKDNVVCCEICQRAKRNVNHIKKIDIEYPDILNDDERVENDLNRDKKSQYDSSSSSVSGSNHNIVGFPVDNPGNDADRLVNLFPHRMRGQSVFPKNYNDFVVESKVKYGLGNYSFSCLVGYVDDIIITGNNISEIEKFKVFLKSKFMIKDLGELKYFLRIEVIDTDKGVFLNQRKYIHDLLSEYGMLACKPAKTLLMSKLVISNEACDNDPLLENFMHPLTYHYRIAFKILRYLKSCQGLGMHIAKTSGMFLNAYSDADWAKCIVTRKPVIGYCVFLNNSLVSWKNILTKGLDTIRHSELVKRLGMHDVYQALYAFCYGYAFAMRHAVNFLSKWVKTLVSALTAREETNGISYNIHSKRRTQVHVDGRPTYGYAQSSVWYFSFSAVA
ncbi:ribonuclease H-like domain-containing protein [Tanacetum coccineum]